MGNTVGLTGYYSLGGLPVEKKNSEFKTLVSVRMFLQTLSDKFCYDCVAKLNSDNLFPNKIDFLHYLEAKKDCCKSDRELQAGTEVFYQIFGG